MPKDSITLRTAQAIINRGRGHMENEEYAEAYSKFKGLTALYKTRGIEIPEEIQSEITNGFLYCAGKQIEINEDYTAAHMAFQNVINLYNSQNIEIPKEIHKQISGAYRHFTKETLADIRLFIKEEKWELVVGCIQQLETILKEAEIKRPQIVIKRLQQQIPTEFLKTNSVSLDSL